MDYKAMLLQLNARRSVLLRKINSMTHAIDAMKEPDNETSDG